MGATSEQGLRPAYSPDRRSGTWSGRPTPTLVGHLRVWIAVALALVVTVAVPTTTTTADTGGAVPGTPRGTAAAIDAGSVHSCARLANGTVKCWGRGTNGQLGQGSTDDIGHAADTMGDELDPVDLGTGRTATAIIAGDLHTCALLDDASVKCWGFGDSGRLGQGDTDTIGDDPGEMGDSLAPVDLGTGRTATAVAAGGAHTCALLDDGTVKCWGYGVDGQLGQGNTDSLGDDPGEMGDSLAPVDLGTGRTATALAAGFAHTCALLDDGTVKCWGDGDTGQLGQGGTDKIGDAPGEMGDDLAPVDLGTDRTATAITAGSSHTCALLDTGAVKCWGSGGGGQLGQGGTADIGDNAGEMGDSLARVDLGTGRTATAIAAGGAKTCALLDDATTKCWGVGSLGQLGQGDTEHIGDEPDEMGNFLPAIKLGPGRTAAAVAAGGSHTCAALDNGTAKCWGYGIAGQLGQENTDNVGDDPGEMGGNLDPIDLGSGAGSSVVPVTVTPAPPVGVAVSANSPVTVSWTEPSDDGGDPVTGYRIQHSTDGTTWSTTVADTGSTATSYEVTGLTVGDTVRFRVAAINSVGVGVVSLPSAPIVVPAASYVALDPARLLDTRSPGGATIDGQFAAAGKLAGGGEIALQVGGRGGVPADAAAVVLNVTVNEPDQAGFVTVYPCGAPRPNASNLNFTPGQTIPNNVIVKVGDGGRVCLYSDQNTNLLADVNGYAPAGSDYTALDPARLLDTRNPGGATIDGQFAAAGKLVGGGEIALQVGGRGGVPGDAEAVVLNVTVNEPDQAGFVTVYPCGTPRPNASNLNFTVGQTIPNNAVVKVGDGGQVCLYSDQTTNLLADVNGYYPAGTGYTALDPARLLDTRNPGGTTTDGQFAAAGELVGGGEIALQVGGRGGAPTDAGAVVLNVTVNDPDQAGFVTVYPCGTSRPNASNLNFTPGQTIPNNVIVKVGDGGQVCLYSDQTTNLIADINGVLG